jgi:hypothetical protein
MPKSRSQTSSRSDSGPRYYGFWTATARRAAGHGRVTVMHPGLMQASLRRAKIGFWITFALVAVFTVVGARAVTHTAVTWLVGLIAGLAAGAVVYVLAFCWPALRLVLHWAAELTLAAVLLAAYSVLTAALPVHAAIPVALAITAAVISIGRLRRLLLALGWCVITRHRLRVCFAEFIRDGHTDGRLPLILLARPTPAGERIWVWLRAGLCLGDLEDRFEEIAVATWATEAHAVRSLRWAALIRVDITRRNALAHLVGSPLTDTLPTPAPADTVRRPTAAPRPVFTTGLDLPDVPDPYRRNGSPHAAPRRPSATPPPPATTPGTDDTADWI